VPHQARQLFPAKVFFCIFTSTMVTTTATSKKDYVLTDVSPVIRPDTRRTYCLDYLASAFADDLVTVTRSRRRRRRFAAVVEICIFKRGRSDRYHYPDSHSGRNLRALSATLRGGGSDDTISEAVADLHLRSVSIRRNRLSSTSVSGNFGFCFVLESFTVWSANPRICPVILPKPDRQ